jgi:hypothetical protein
MILPPRPQAAPGATETFARSLQRMKNEAGAAYAVSPSSSISRILVVSLVSNPSRRVGFVQGNIGSTPVKVMGPNRRQGSGRNEPDGTTSRTRSKVARSAPQPFGRLDTSAAGPSVKKNGVGLRAAPLNCDLEIFGGRLAGIIGGIWSMNAPLPQSTSFNWPRWIPALCAVPRTPTMLGAREHRIPSPEQHVGEGILLPARDVLRLQPPHRTAVRAVNSRFN